MVNEWVRGVEKSKSCSCDAFCIYTSQIDAITLLWKFDTTRGYHNEYQKWQRIRLYSLFFTKLIKSYNVGSNNAEAIAGEAGWKREKSWSRDARPVISPNNNSIHHIRWFDWGLNVNTEANGISKRNELEGVKLKCTEKERGRESERNTGSLVIYYICNRNHSFCHIDDNRWICCIQILVTQLK